MLKSYIIIALLSIPNAFSAAKANIHLDKRVARTILKLNEKNSKKLNRHYYSKLIKLIDEIQKSSQLVSPRFNKLGLKKNN